jgi:DNA replication protein DnaC
MSGRGGKSYLLTMAPRPAPRDLRASDSDRDRFVTTLAAALADGRLTSDEHGERTEAALSARTLGELAALTADLVPAAQQPVRLDDVKAIAAMLRIQERHEHGVGSAIEEAARILRLPAVIDVYDDAAAYALRERSTYKEYLASVLGAEVVRRDEVRRRHMVRQARFPRAKRIEDFDYAANPNVSAEQVAGLRSPGWVTAGESLCLIGGSGTGKSHLLIGIGTAIAEAGLKVRYTTTANLVNELAEAADNKQLTKVLARYSRCDLLCLDEFGYLDLSVAATGLLFQVFTDRAERRAMAVAANAPVAEWRRIFADPRLCEAVVDRLTRDTHVVETGCESYRPAPASHP